MKLIKGVEIYAPEKLGKKDILICNDKIIKVHKDIEIEFMPLEIIDGNGKLAVPGFIDQHVHVIGGGGEGGFKTRAPELRLSNCIKAGVTTLVGLLGTDSTTRSIENLLAKTKALNEEGITAYCLTGGYEYPSPTLTGSIKKDIIFIEEVIGVKIAISDHRSSHITKNELIRLASDVRTSSLIGGKPGVVHFHLGNGKEGLNIIFDILKETDIPIKHFRPTHVKKALDQSIEFAKLGGYIDFTAGSNIEETADSILFAMGKVPNQLITVSSDANGSSPKWNTNKEMIGIEVASMKTLHSLIQFLILEKKIDITKALALVTSNVAKALELYPKKGIIAEGCDADILLLDNNFEIDTVIAQGEYMMLNKEIKQKSTYEE